MKRQASIFSYFSASCSSQSSSNTQKVTESNDELLSNTEADTVEPVAERNSPPEEELENYDDIVEESSDAAETPSAILNKSTILPPGLQLDTCNKWKSQYTWLLVQDGKLYCKTCKEVAVIPQSESASTQSTQSYLNCKS